MRIKSLLIFFIAFLCILACFTACLYNKEENQDNIIVKFPETGINDAVSENGKPAMDTSPADQNNEQTVNNNYGYYKEPVFKPGDRLLFVLQCADFNELSEAEFDIAVIDCDDSCLTEKEIRNLEEQGKSIISYLSIGEAENYRSYWQRDWKPGNPDFIEYENPNWPGNFKVKFWYSQWQKIMFSKLDEIVSLGYDGVYLDIVDAYKYFENKDNNGNDSVDTKLEMVEFVKAISARAKTINPKFLIIPQNAEELVLENGYLDAIDGLGRENLCFEKNVRIENEIMSEVLEDINYAKNNGKFVFAISYVNDKNLADEFLQLCSIHGFIPYIGPVELNLVE